jgi:hypothetical protein
MIAYLGDGKASPGLSYAPQILTTDQYLLALVSPDLSAGVIGESFTEACDRNEEPKARALALKYAMRELSKSNRFSFVLLDLKATRVFAASTANCSPIAAGHAPDSTLFLVCNRSPGRAARKWPPRWAQGVPQETYDRPSHIAEYNIGQRVPQIVRSLPTSASKLSHGPGRGRKKEPISVTPEDEFSSSSSQILGWCCRQSEAPLTLKDECGSSETANKETLTARLFHLPVGRFVYGRNHLYPAEFNSFWKSEIPIIPQDEIFSTESSVSKYPDS